MGVRVCFPPTLMLFGLRSPPHVRFCGLPEKHAMKNHRRENLLTRYPQLIAD
jgi:hypothetical protein